LTAEEFEAAYAARSGVTVEWLHAHGRYAEPCDCGDEVCEGWAMGHQREDAIVEDALRSPDGEPRAGDPGGGEGKQGSVSAHGRTPG
jgi:hypothetical protein